MRQRSRRPLARIPLPSIILANAQSLRNKTGDLQALIRFQHDYKNACILVLTETWLGEMDLDSDLALDGFGLPLCTDRDALAGSVCTFMNAGVKQP